VEPINLLFQPFTDAGNAERLIALHGEDLKYISARGWLVWRKTHWDTDETGGAVQATLAMARTLLEQADALPINDAMRPAAIAFSRKSESSASIKAALSLALTFPDVARRIEDFDSNPYLLNCAAGTIDLKISAIYAHLRSDLLTVCAPAGLSHASGRWQTFLQEILPDPDLLAYVQRAIGASVIGNQREHAIFFAHGGGGNGKGTFFRALTSALGAYVVTIPPHMLLETHQPAHPTEIADLYGKRLAVSAEIPKGKKLDEAKIKSMSGGDRMKGRFMFKDFIEWDPTHTLWICGNDKPRISGTDRGIWRRLHLIPFTAELDGASADLDLDARLAAERDSIMQWCVDGAVAYLAQGLGTCQAVEDATQSYRADEDTFGNCLDSLVDFDPDASTSKLEFRELIKIMYENAGSPFPPSDRAIKAELDKRGVTSARHTGDDSRERVWTGIKIKQLTAAQLRKSVADKADAKRKNWQDGRES